MDARFSKLLSKKHAIKHFVGTLPPNMAVFITEAPGSSFDINVNCASMDDCCYVQDQWRKFLERNYNYIAD